MSFITGEKANDLRGGPLKKLSFPTSDLLLVPFAFAGVPRCGLLRLARPFLSKVIQENIVIAAYIDNIEIILI